MSGPIFIVGSPRSGTSIFTWCLGQHPNIYPLEETVWFGKFAHGLEAAYRLGSSRAERSQLSAMGITHERFFEAFGRAIDELIHEHRTRAKTKVAPGVAFARVRSPADPKSRWVDGTPENSFHVPRLRQLWPDARFIHLVRDARAVARSLCRFSRAGGRDHDPNEAYEKWVRHVRACIEAEEAGGSEVVHRLYHAELVESPEAALRGALAFAGEAYDSACLLPLGTRINSSRVPDGDLDLSDMDPEILAEARDLTRLLFEDAPAGVGARP